MGPSGSAGKEGGLDKLYVQFGKEGGEGKCLPLPRPLLLPWTLAGEVVEPGDGPLLCSLPLPLLCPLPLAGVEVTGLRDLTEEGEGGE